jgi:hypothetical protein
MSQPRVKWGDIERFCKRNGYEIKGRGGDKIIVAPKGDGVPRSRNTVRIGHKSCGHKGAEVLECYISSLKRAFGITRRQLLDA